MVAPSNPDIIPSQYSKIIDEDDIKNGVRNMLVDSIGKFHLKALDSVHDLAIPVLREFSEEEPGRSFLRIAARNSKHLEDLVGLLGRIPPEAEKMDKTLMDYMLNDTCAFLGVPYWLLDRMLLLPTQSQLNGH